MFWYTATADAASFIAVADSSHAHVMPARVNGGFFPPSCVAAHAKAAKSRQRTTHAPTRAAAGTADWRTKAKPISPGSVYPAKEHCSQARATYFFAAAAAAALD